MQAGFIGLGRLGTAMAQRLLDEGVELIVWNRTLRKARHLPGAQIADSPANLICRVPLTFVNVIDSTAVRQVLSGPAGLLEGDCEGKIIVDTTTHHFEAVPQFYSLAAERGFRYLESPLSGSVEPARAGKLAAFVSGDRATFDEALPYVQKIAASVLYTGGAGLATRLKLINNALLASFMAALAEAIALGERAGLSREQMLEGLASGAGNSSVLAGKREKLLKEDYTAHFPVDLLYRDVGYAQELAGSLRRPFFTGGLARELFGLALSRGLGEQDFSAIYGVVKQA